MPSKDLAVRLQVVTAGLSSGLAKTKTAMMSADKTVTKGLGGWYNSIRKVNQATVNLNKDLNRANAGFKGFGKGIGGFGGIGKLGAIYMVSRSLIGYIQSSVDMIETQNLFNVSMRSTSEETGKLVTKMSELYGLDPTNLKNSIGTYSLLARSMGMGAEQSAKLATNTTQLALDLSSLMNIPIQQVMADLRSGLVGQSETVYKYGIDVTEAGLKAEAMAQGITKSVRNMSQGEKMALRASVMIKQGFLASGDFAKTLEQPANQLKILSERMVTFGRAVGSIFMPMLGVALPYLNAFVAVLTRGAQALASLFGYVAPKDQNLAENVGAISEEADNATDSVNELANAVKNATLGIDELNVLDKSTSSGGDEGVGSASIISQIDVGTYSSLMDTIKSKTNDLRDNMIQFFREFANGFDFTNLKASWVQLQAVIDPFVENLKIGLGWVWENILKPFALWTINEFLPEAIDTVAVAFEWLNNTLEILGPLFKSLWDVILGPFAKFLGDTLILLIRELNKQLRTGADQVVADNPKWLMFITTLGIMAFAIAPVQTAIVGLILILAVLSKKWQEASIEFKFTWYSTWIAIGNFLIDVSNNLIQVIAGFVNGLIQEFNNLMDVLGMSWAKTDWEMNIDLIPHWKMPNIDKEFIGNVNSRQIGGATQFASGGFPEMGQMFIAREAGPELVGNIGGSSAVVNNDQIVDAVAQGVASAVEATIGNRNEQPIILTLDGQVIYTNQQKIANSRGVNLGMGVFAR